MTRTRHGLRFEFLLGSVLLGLGLFAMPAVVYLVGVSLFGPYGERAEMGRFYGDFFGDLATGSFRAWLLLLGPLVIISLLRLIFLRRPVPEQPAAEPGPARPSAATQRPATTPAPGGTRRREPRIGPD